MRLAYCFAKVFKILKITFQTDYRNRKADRIIAAARTAARSSNITIHPSKKYVGRYAMEGNHNSYVFTI